MLTTAENLLFTLGSGTTGRQALNATTGERPYWQHQQCADYVRA